MLVRSNIPRTFDFILREFLRAPIARCIETKVIDRIRGIHEEDDELAVEPRSKETLYERFTISWADETQRLSFTAGEAPLLGLVPTAERRWDNRENAIESQPTIQSSIRSNVHHPIGASDSAVSSTVFEIRNGYFPD